MQINPSHPDGVPTHPMPLQHFLTEQLHTKMAHKTKIRAIINTTTHVVRDIGNDEH